jgi:REP element-mobilizing transposase RayT
MKAVSGLASELKGTMLVWHSRDYLPHIDQPGLVQAITFRLCDSVPASLMARWRSELLGTDSDLRSRAASAFELLKRIAHYEDAGHGKCHLREPRIAQVVENALLHFVKSRYHLLAWCVMPNHIHVIIETLQGFPMSQVVHSWKSYTAKVANKLLGLSGAFWQREYHDRFIRDEKHLEVAISYVERNPVVARLVLEPAEWKWSSASRRKQSDR